MPHQSPLAKSRIHTCSFNLRRTLHSPPEILLDAQPADDFDIISCIGRVEVNDAHLPDMQGISSRNGREV